MGGGKTFAFRRRLLLLLL